MQFTGSVNGGLAVKSQLSQRFISSGFELGGKDPAYVREDADIDFAVENIVDGICYNSGQSCCAVERVYVHEKVYDSFIEKAVALVKKYKLGDPFVEATNLGPVVNVKQATSIRAQVSDAGIYTFYSSEIFFISLKGCKDFDWEFSTFVG